MRRSVRRAVSLLMVLIVGASIGATSPPHVAAIDQQCRWLESVDSLGFNRFEMLPALGCRLNANGEWITGTILSEDELVRYISTLPAGHEEQFNLVVSGTPLEVPSYYQITVLGRTFTYSELVLMTEDQRRYLAESWLAEQLAPERYHAQWATYQESVELAIPFLHDAINDMLANPRLSRAFEYDITTGEFRVGSNFLLAGSTARLVNMKGQPLFGSGNPDVYEAYETAAYTYMTTPGHEVLVQYATWYVQRRDAAVLSVTSTNAYNPLANDALMSWGEYQQMPWPWQLADVNTITEYTIWVIDTYGP